MLGGFGIRRSYDADNRLTEERTIDEKNGIGRRERASWECGKLSGFYGSVGEGFLCSNQLRAYRRKQERNTTFDEVIRNFMSNAETDKANETMKNPELLHNFGVGQQNAEKNI